MFESGRDALPDIWELSGGPPGCPGVFKKPFWMSGIDQEALQDVREWSGGSPVCPGEVGMHARMSGSGPKISPKYPKGPHDHSRTSGRAS